jgi:hypothetical protein
MARESVTEPKGDAEMEKEVLDLTTMAGLNAEVISLFKSLSASMEQEGDKASINISIDMKRVRDTSSLMDVTWKVKPSYPGRSRKIMAHADLIGNLTVDAAPNAAPKQRSVFENAGD